MDDVLETIQIALSGATSLLRKISTGNTRLVPALKKIMEAAMDAINMEETLLEVAKYYKYTG